MKTLMITGAGGLIGSAVIRQLAQEDKNLIVAVTSGRRKVFFPSNVREESANLLVPEEQRALLERVKPDVLYHLAWALDGEGFLSSDNNIRWLEASCSLLRTFAEIGGKEFFFAGSSAEYGAGEYCKEDDICAPQSLYGECKLAFDRIADSFCRLNGIRFVCTRFFSVYGPGDRRLGRALPTAVQTLLKGEPFTCKGPNNAWDYVFTEDIGRAVSVIISSDITGPVNVSSGKAVTMKQVFTEISRELNGQKLLSFENENQSGHYLVGDNSVLRGIGFFDYTPLEDGIRKTIQWWREQI